MHIFMEQNIKWIPHEVKLSPRAGSEAAECEAGWIRQPHHSICLPRASALSFTSPV